jgi:hypothetical protein
MFLGVVAIGVVLGLAIGALAGYGTYRPCTDPTCIDFGREFEVLSGATVGAVAGAIAAPTLWLLWRCVDGSRARWPKAASTSPQRTCAEPLEALGLELGATEPLVYAASSVTIRLRTSRYSNSRTSGDDHANRHDARASAQSPPYRLAFANRQREKRGPLVLIVSRRWSESAINKCRLRMFV